jgi:hypothetical protein
MTVSNGSLFLEVDTKEVYKYRVIPSVLDPRKCEYLKDHSLDIE